MGVFAMFRRKKQDVVEVSPEETGTVAPAEGEVADSEAEADVVAEAPAEDGAGSPEGTEGVDADEVTAVEIPKQQSVEAAADNETGEGARR